MDGHKSLSSGRYIDTDAFSQQFGGTSPGHILQDREIIDMAAER